MLKQWIIFNKLENFNSILNYTIDDFTPSGNLSYMNQHGEILHHTPLREVFNLRCYIQHLMDESEDETQNRLSYENWMKPNNWKFIKFPIHHRHPMTPEQPKQNPFKVIFKNQHEKVDTDEGESNEEEDKSTTSSDKSEQNSESDITTEDEEETYTTETHQVHNVLNETIHDEENLSEAEDDSSDDKYVIDIEPPKENGEQEIGKQDKLLTTTFQMEIENRNVEGLITYSTDQQIFKFKVNSWRVNVEFTLYELKWTIDAILQHMGFYHTTENPCVMMRVNHKTKSCECIIIHQDELYIASNTLQEILHIVKEKYKIKIIPNDYQGSNFPYDPGGTLIC